MGIRQNTWVVGTAEDKPHPIAIPDRNAQDITSVQVRAGAVLGQTGGIVNHHVGADQGFGGLRVDNDPLDLTGFIGGHGAGK
ncbi:TPA: hypothetical protein DCE37_01130 [Candidatus Latescibacteria bacterium]|nr:hypothetical protein [Candidatus Latescibacterota bacterium]